MSFFIRSGRNKKGIAAKRPKKEVSKKSQKQSRKTLSEEVFSDSDLESDLEDSRKGEVLTESGTDEEETAQEKRLRLAKQYLAQLEQEVEDDSEEEETSHDTVAKKLKQQFLEQSGKLQRDIAQTYIQPTADDISVLRGHKLSVTCLVVAPDNNHVFTASKDSSVIKWDVVNRKKVRVLHGGKKGTEDSHPGHTAPVLAMAISTDNKYLVSGDTNKLIYVWNPETFEKIHILTGHRDAVCGLAFRKGSHQLFSASHDRIVKVWNLDEMAYIETLFGHQDTVTAIDSLSRERAITSGGRDGSVRVWKIIEESQLVFNGHSDSIDCVALINEEHFVSGAADNSLALWSIMKKKPLCTVRPAHPGADGTTGVAENWLTSVTSLQHTDLVASGSRDGCVRLWRCGTDYRSLHLLFSVPVEGFVNSLRFSGDGLQLMAGIGQEHRLGRWWRIKEAKNALVTISLSRSTANTKITNEQTERNISS